MAKITKAQAIEALWRRGILKWKLRQEQQDIYDILKNSTGMKYVLYCSRRWGKSFICLLLAGEDALQGPRRHIGFVAPTQKQVKRIIFPIMDFIFKDCPDDLRPKFDRDLSCYEFPNKSKIYLSGTDNKHYEDLLGMTLYRGYIDEPGTCDDLDIIVNRILQPQTLTTKRSTGSNLILLGTPSPSAAHPYYFIKEQCRSQGNFSRRTIDDNKALDVETKEAFIAEAGGRDHTNCKREYFCEDVTDSEKAVLPEFTEEKEKELVVDYPRPPAIDWYGSMDPAFNDFTAYLLGYYDFQKAVYVIESEALFNKSNTHQIAERIRSLEIETVGNQKIYLRVSDTDPQIICDLAQLHNIDFVSTAKDNKEAQINCLRTLIQNNKLFIHPRCKHLIRQMHTAIWNDARTRYVRTVDDGHFDTIDALMYLVRNIDKYRNPYPASRIDWDLTGYAGEFRQSRKTLANAILGQ